VLSHRIPVIGWQDCLYKPGASWAVVSVDCLYKPGASWAVASVEHRAVVSSNTLQRQPALVLSGCVCREGAEDDDSDSNQHCREHTYGDVGVDVFHKLACISDLTGVKDKSRLLLK
jgi:hypothetical protein